MSSPLQVGLESEQSHEVTPDMSPEHLPVSVLSTPDMIRLIEQTCLSSVQPLLDDGQTSVGTHVCVSHSGPAAEGEHVRVHCRLSDISKRRLTFEVTVTAAAGTISEGTHQRAIVDLARMRGS